MSPGDDAAERARRRAERARREGGRPEPRPAGPRRPRRGVPVLLAVLGALIALGVGILVGYQARGEDPPAGLQTVERRVVTVTVPESP